MFENAWFYADYTHFEFSVRGCKDVMIYLASLPMNASPDIEGYKIGIGAQENTRTFLREYPSRTEVENVGTLNILSCHSLRRFWISWKDSTLTVGSGDLYSREIFSHVKPGMNIRAISVTMAGPGGTALFEVPRSTGKLTLAKAYKATF